MDPSNFGYHNLRYFSIVFEERNLSKAAEKIAISRQALSKSITSMEQALEKQLFIRSQHGVEPTAAAFEFYSHAKTILREYELINNQSMMEQLNDRRVTIYTIDAISQIFPNSFYEEFFHKYPDILVTIEETNEEFAIKQLLTNRCDLAIVSHESSYYDFDYTFLFHSVYGAYMSADHPLSKIEHLSLSDFENTRFIGKTMALEYYNKAVQAVYSKNLKIDFFLELTNPGKRRELVRSGNFLSCSWNYNLFNDMNDGIVFRTVEEMGAGIEIYLIENKTLKQQKKNTAIFKKYLINWIRSHQK